MGRIWSLLVTPKEPAETVVLAPVLGERFAFSHVRHRGWALLAYGYPMIQVEVRGIQREVKWRSWPEWIFDGECKQCDRAMGDVCDSCSDKEARRQEGWDEEPVEERAEGEDHALSGTWAKVVTQQDLAWAKQYVKVTK